MLNSQPAVSHRFMVNFLFDGVLDPFDLSFQRVRGLSRELGVHLQPQGGENARNMWVTDKINHGSLVLERGVMLASPVTLLFDRILRGEALYRACVVILLLDSQQLPVTTWTLSGAFPVRWETSELDANSNTVLINTLELRYQDMRLVGIKL